MADSQGDVYVRRDVFEARMDRMERLLEKTSSEIREIRNEMRLLDSRLTNISHISIFAVIGFWLILGIAVLIVIVKRACEPSLTQKDIERVAERVANTVIERHLSGGK